MGRNFDSQEQIGRAIKRARNLRGLMKQYTLVERSGIDQSSLSQIENRGWNLKLVNLAKICAGLGVYISELLVIADAPDTVEGVPDQPEPFDSPEKVLDLPALGRAIREVMDIRKMNDVELTRRTGFAKKTVERAVAGTGSPTIGTISRIAHVLEVARAELFARAEALHREAGGAGATGAGKTGDRPSA